MRMLDREFFCAGTDALILRSGGGFTGFLIRRFGWDQYRRFYSKADRWTFRSLFQRQFGMSFEAAWRRCHDESVAMASLTEDFRRTGCSIQCFNPDWKHLTQHSLRSLDDFCSLLPGLYTRPWRATRLKGHHHLLGSARSKDSIGNSKGSI
jgi:hypothetical protein